MRKYVRDKLLEIGITSNGYVLVRAKNGRLVVSNNNSDPGQILLPERWGITLEQDGKIQAVIEYEQGPYGSKGMYYLRSKRGAKDYISRHKLQRTAIAAFLEGKYKIPR